MFIRPAECGHGQGFIRAGPNAAHEIVIIGFAAVFITIACVNCIRFIYLNRIS
jgi:hypothetical protein